MDCAEMKALLERMSKGENLLEKEQAELSTHILLCEDCFDLYASVVKAIKDAKKLPA